MTLFSTVYRPVSALVRSPIRLLGLTISVVAFSSIPLIPGLASATALRRFPNSLESRIAQSRAIPAASAESETLYLNTNRTYNYNLVVVTTT
ncbi:MAG: hypothetical protein MUC48_27250 [Leptolyngbya sp. Prado105]|jgi:hypothetical protein|nr:hypothetical protein [Leptolyngbya sp. Prado105]